MTRSSSERRARWFALLDRAAVAADAVLVPLAEKALELLDAGTRRLTTRRETMDAPDTPKQSGQRTLTDHERLRLTAMLTSLHAPRVDGEPEDRAQLAEARLRQARIDFPDVCELIGDG